MGVLNSPISDQRKLFIERTVYQVSRNGSKTHLGSTEILEDGDVSIDFPTYPTNVGEEGGMFLVRSVRKIEPEHVDAGVDEPAQDCRLSGRRANRRYDLRPNRGQGVATRARHDSFLIKITAPVPSSQGSAPSQPRAPSNPTHCHTRI